MLCASLFGHFVKFEADPLLEESLERGGYRRAHAEEAEVAQQRARGRSIGAAIRTHGKTHQRESRPDSWKVHFNYQKRRLSPSDAANTRPPTTAGRRYQWA